MMAELSEEVLRTVHVGDAGLFNLQTLHRSTARNKLADSMHVLLRNFL